MLHRPDCLEMMLWPGRCFADSYPQLQINVAWGVVLSRDEVSLPATEKQVVFGDCLQVVAFSLGEIVLLKNIPSEQPLNDIK